MVQDHYYGTVYFSQSLGISLTLTFDVNGSEILFGSLVNILNILDGMKDFFTQLFHHYTTFF